MKSPYVLSQTAEYALRAVLYVARRAPDSVRLPEIAAEIRAPARYLAKILGQLARSGILISTRGPSGGFRLAPGRMRASLSSIVAVIEEPERRRCLLGHGLCGQSPNCPVHAGWAPIAQSSADFFASTTLTDLLSTTPHARG